mmetsp:Transcript_9437/g.16103  ORF Transcript_9437/g.16103 Transcript_9437/m.16103 type:complete len:214 (-) Transcript_9437:870-1511(-)
MAPLQKASSGRMEKGSSIEMPTSSMPKRKKAEMKVAGTVAQWFHDSPSAPQRARGRRVRKSTRKRERRRVYSSGMGDLKMRSLAPVRSTSTEMEASILAASMGLMSALRSVAETADRQNIGRLDAAIVLSACCVVMRPAATSSYSSERRVSSSVGPRRKLRSALMNDAVSAAIRRLSSLWYWSSGKKVLLWRTTLRQLLISPPHSVRASFQRE